MAQKVTVSWLGQIRVREATDNGTPICEGAEYKFYNWSLVFVRAETEEAIKDAVKAKIKELKEQGKVIGDECDAVKIEAITHILTCYSVKEFETS